MMDIPETSHLYASPTIYRKWRIKNFFDLPTKDNFELQSSQFCLFDWKWFFKIYPNGCVENNSAGFIDIFLFREAPFPEECVASLKMGIISADGSEKFKSFNPRALFSKVNCGLGFSNIVKRSTLKNLKNTLVPKSTLTVFCYIRLIGPVLLEIDALSRRARKADKLSHFYMMRALSDMERAYKTKTSVNSTVKAASPTSASDSMQTLIDNFKDMYVNRRSTDITIVVKGNKFLAHKVVLAARSVVFAAMFDHDMMEKNSGVVEISDCDPEHFEKFLLFLYTAKLDVVSSSNAVSLYEISEKYNVQELKEECQQCMANEINIDIFCDVLHLSIIYNESNLRKSAIDFFIKNVKYILPTPKWLNFLVEHPILCNNFLIEIVQLKFSKKNHRLFINGKQHMFINDVIYLLDGYNESKLQKFYAICFFINNVKYILPTTKWQNLLVKHPIMCNNLLIETVNKWLNCNDN